MRLNNKSKIIVLGNIELLKYCKSSGIDVNKLKKCNIEKMGDRYIFVLSKENKPKSKSALPLDIDLDTQPDVILIIDVTEDGVLKFETTDKTVRVLIK